MNWHHTSLKNKVQMITRQKYCVLLDNLQNIYLAQKFMLYCLLWLLRSLQTKLIFLHWVQDVATTETKTESTVVFLSETFFKYIFWKILVYGVAHLIFPHRQVQWIMSYFRYTTLITHLWYPDLSLLCIKHLQYQHTGWFCGSTPNSTDKLTKWFWVKKLY